MFESCHPDSMKRKQKVTKPNLQDKVSKFINSLTKATTTHNVVWELRTVMVITDSGKREVQPTVFSTIFKNRRVDLFMSSNKTKNLNISILPTTKLDYFVPVRMQNITGELVDGLYDAVAEHEFDAHMPNISEEEVAAADPPPVKSSIVLPTDDREQSFKQHKKAIDCVLILLIIAALCNLVSVVCRLIQ